MLLPHIEKWEQQSAGLRMSHQLIWIDDTSPSHLPLAVPKIVTDSKIGSVFQCAQDSHSPPHRSCHRVGSASFISWRLSATSDWRGCRMLVAQISTLGDEVWSIVCTQHQLPFNQVGAVISHQLYNSKDFYVLLHRAMFLSLKELDFHMQSSYTAPTHITLVSIRN